MKLIQLSSGERYALSDLIYGFIDSPREAQSDIASDLVAPRGPRIITGFEASLDGSVVTVSAGKALLTLKEGSKVTPGLVVTQEAGPQSFDCKGLKAGTYGLFVTFASLPTDKDTRTTYASQDIGFDRNQQVFTRLAASWSLQVAEQLPGDEYTQVATVALPDGTLTDTRALLFEGDASKDFEPTWGSDDDRSDDRGKAPIGDLETMLEALRVAISDVKGGPWYSRTSGGGGGTGGTDPGKTGIIIGQGAPVEPPPAANYLYFDQDTATVYPAT
jgi:hypothetical protein